MAIPMQQFDQGLQWQPFEHPWPWFVPHTQSGLPSPCASDLPRNAAVQRWQNIHKPRTQGGPRYGLEADLCFGPWQARTPVPTQTASSSSGQCGLVASATKSVRPAQSRIRSNSLIVKRQSKVDQPARCFGLVGLHFNDEHRYGCQRSASCRSASAPPEEAPAGHSRSCKMGWANRCGFYFSTWAACAKGRDCKFCHHPCHIKRPGAKERRKAKLRLALGNTLGINCSASVKSGT
mmetsp:Transcript_89879/g.178650  ORF Transcript_89879/g.178650 Transcript_89879/m.178650 type:complete len:235 (-) Transcript_89879:23-727(-)